jgi:hypothetical protein
MALNTSGIATGIASLSVSGVTFKNITTIPRSVRASDCPIFFPDPADWFTGTNSSPETFGIADAMWTADRRFKYIYLHGISTAANTIATYYNAMIAKTDLIWEALAEMNVAGVDVRSIAISQFGELQAPAAGNSQIRNVFFGCFFEIGISEKVNA